MPDTRLRHAVNGLAGQCGKSGLRTHVDDASKFLPDHHTTDCLTREESAFEIDFHSSVVISFGYVLSGVLGRDASVVDQDIDPAK
jgi:hypothetical protein